MPETLEQFFAELPFTPPLFTTPKGDAVVHLALQRDGSIAVKWLASIHRGAGRAALAAIIKAADRHGVTLELTARPERSPGEGKQMTPEKLEAFYGGFGFVVTRRGSEGFAHMVRRPTGARHD